MRLLSTFGKKNLVCINSIERCNECFAERQLEGITLAKKRGVYKGRKKALNDEQALELKQRIATGEQKSKIASEFGISRETLYQYLK